MSEQQSLQIQLAKTLNASVLSVIGSENIILFERAYMVANAVQELQAALTTEYMKPIMALQGNRLGFKTDKDTSGGYPENVVKNCLIEAVLMGVQPTGNQFNIISGNCYITKEGFGYLLGNIKGLSYTITPELPRIKDASAAIVMKIEWTICGVTQTKNIDVAVKVNSFMGADAVVGKATRKARAWLFGAISGVEIPEGETIDGDAVEISSSTNVDKEKSRVLAMLSDCNMVADLEKLKPNIPEKYNDIYNHRLEELSK